MQPSSPGPTARVLAHWLRGPSAWLALVVPLVVTLGRLAPSSQWRDDVAIVRGLGFVPIGAEGIVSSVCMQATSLWPIGGRLLRAAIPSAIAAALAAYLIFRFTLRLLDKNVPAPRLSPLMALVASWAVVLGPLWQSEATVAGGGSVAAALVLLAAWMRFRYRLEARGWAAFGVATGFALLESRSAGLACLCLLLLDAAMLRQLPTGRQLLMLCGAMTLVLGIGLLPFLLQPKSGGVWTSLGSELGKISEASRSALPIRSTLDAWLQACGLLTLGLGVLGALWGLARPRTRPWLTPLLAFPLLDLALPSLDTSGLVASPGVAVRLLAVALAVVCAALCLHTLGLTLSRAKLPFARPAQALLVASSLTFVLIMLDESAHRRSQTAHHAAEAWTDEAVGSLPPKSLLMVKSEAVAWRLWASRVVRGQRPDLTVVPLPLLDRGDTARRLLELEPELAPLIRELRVSGKPNEYALSSLADARPLYLEFDPEWDRRLLEHVLPHPFWVRFAPHALGRSDRTAALEEGREAFGRVLKVATQPAADPATLSVLTTGAREQAIMLAALGDKQNAGALVEDLGQLPEEQGFVTAMQTRLSGRLRAHDFFELLE